MHPESLQLAMHVALGNFDKIKELCSLPNVDIDAWQPGSMTALITAACNNNVQIAEYLLEKGANPNLLIERRIDALKSAAAQHHSAMVKLLLKYGANPNQENENGNVALMLLCDDNPFESQEQKELFYLLFNATDEKYHQRAYQYCTNPELQEYIKSKHVIPDNVIVSGGPNYQRRIKLATPPKNPVALRWWNCFREFNSQSTDCSARMMGCWANEEICQEEDFNEDTMGICWLNIYHAHMDAFKSFCSEKYPEILEFCMKKEAEYEDFGDGNDNDIGNDK